ncbi:DinB family protein [Amorphus orientalis]|uniref:Damage-inducible protein DinB n=1 Tax=Amorphus orientalis TaxID=649198 RepID=A0AAE3VP25_9HYPH|nr:DinB family protein [Amorphus orientalis]MDQ0315632.1 putative damage-inducible protein DinB [Amorphus orientalis]
MQHHFGMMAGYNAWCNDRLYEAAAAISDENYRADQGAFFKSVHGTLNHILVADRIWLNRFTGDGPSPSSLDEILFEEFDALRSARRAEDTRIVRFVDGLSDQALADNFHYRPMTDPSRQVSQPLAPALIHFFNHQTHHRGQVHALLTRTVGTAPSLDLIYYQRETGIGLA